MKAAVVDAPGHVTVREVPIPEPGPYDALVRIEACGICNSTDLKIIERHFVSQIPLPLVLGHESVGTVVQVGDKVERYKPGDRVLRAGAVYDYERVGIASAWGGMAQYGLACDLSAWQMAYPGERPNGMWAQQQIVPPEIAPADATSIITLKETLFSTRAAGVDSSTRTAIVGTGPVARAFTFWARHLGAPEVVVFGRRERWRDDFLALGADAYITTDATSSDVGRFERVIEAVGSIAALERALSLIGPQGQVANYGVAPEVDRLSETVRKAREDGRIVDLPVREEKVHEELLGLVRSGEVVLAEWISHRLPLDDLEHGLELVRSKQATKVVLEP